MLKDVELNDVSMAKSKLESIVNSKVDEIQKYMLEQGVLLKGIDMNAETLNSDDGDRTFTFLARSFKELKAMAEELIRDKK